MNVGGAPLKINGGMKMSEEVPTPESEDEDGDCDFYQMGGHEFT